MVWSSFLNKLYQQIKTFHLPSRLTEHLLVSILVAVIVYVIYPAILNVVGPLRFTFYKRVVQSEYLAYANEAYERAQSAVVDANEVVLNFRANKSDPLRQRELYGIIFKNLHDKPKLTFDRVVSSDADPELTSVKDFLDSAGTLENLRIKVFVGVANFPSCLITEREVVLGFLTSDRMISSGLLVRAPSDLVNSIRENYASKIRDSSQNIIIVKESARIITPTQIDSVIHATKLKINHIQSTYQKK